MNQWHYEQARQLFFALCDLPSDVQTRCLEESCWEDHAVQTEVRSLLEEDRRLSEVESLWQADSFGASN